MVKLGEGFVLGYNKKVLSECVSFGIRMTKESLGKKSNLGNESYLLPKVLDNIRLSIKCVVCPSMFM